MNQSEKLLTRINEVSKLTIGNNSTKFFNKKTDAEKLAKKMNADEDPKDPERFIYIVKEVPKTKNSEFRKLGNFFIEIQEPNGFVIGKV